MTGIILQSRLDSSRLPQKAMLDLGGKPVIVRVMENLIRIKADVYVLACDIDSESVFAPLASSCGFICIAGPKEDVLERFCMVIRKTGITTVLRATGDNPFLFSEAAVSSLERFEELQASDNKADYFTYSGLPHGCGIEVFSAKRLLEAASLTDSEYEHEHVGPALYRHRERFVCVFEKAPEAWFFPDMRTTIDTAADYDNACGMAEYILKKNFSLPAACALVLDAWQYVNRTLLFIPSVKVGQGSGHIRRLIHIISSIHNSWRCLIYIPATSQLSSLIPSELQYCRMNELPLTAHLVIIDRFRTSRAEIGELRKIGPVVALDDSGTGRSGADYILDIIPSVPNANANANEFVPEFIPLPVNRKKEKVGTVKKVLVVAGGENAQGQAVPIARLMAGLGYEVTVIDPIYSGITALEPCLIVSGLIPDLRNSLHLYDLVVTHFGFTAFEALAAGCRVLLYSPTPYHFTLGKANGFSVLQPGIPTLSQISTILSKKILIPQIIHPESGSKNLSEEIIRLSGRSVRSCPYCGCGELTDIVARFSDRTIAKCPVCEMNYVAFIVSGERHYSKSYFFDEYRSQYGKTYLEDFDAIRLAGYRRLEIIERAFYLSFGTSQKPDKNLLDIGCAFGPFLSAAFQKGWNVLGTDISPDAVDYVKETLGLPAVISSFPANDKDDTFVMGGYSVISLWYVIEHFADLEPVLGRIRNLLVPGGILAFSTPSCSGVSAIFNRKNFYLNSPSDHFTLWNPLKVRKQLQRYGFHAVRIVSTGHHPERFPGMMNKTSTSVLWKSLLMFSRLFRLGDTFEVYAIKNGTMEDVL